MTTQVDPNRADTDGCPACSQNIPVRKTKLNQVSRLCDRHTSELNQQLSERLAEIDQKNATGVDQNREDGGQIMATQTSLTNLAPEVAIKSIPAMTHSECVGAASDWLSGRCKVVLPEFYSHNKELPDVIGFNRGAVIHDGEYDHREYSILIECKISRGDFHSDKKKSFRANPHEGMGDYRYYCCPKGLLKPEEVPDGWGLIYIYPSGTVRSVKNSVLHNKDVTCEFHLLYYYARRARFAGVHKTIIEYRGYDS